MVVGAGGGVDYIGTWGAGTAYKKGDVVRYNGNDYMAVNDSTGVTPPAAASIPLGGVSIGTSLPASPYDGQEYVLTDSLTAPTYPWRFRYTASITDATSGCSSVASDHVATHAHDDRRGTIGRAPRLPIPVRTCVTLPRAGDYRRRWLRHDGDQRWLHPADSWRSTRPARHRR